MVDEWKEAPRLDEGEGSASPHQRKNKERKKEMMSTRKRRARSVKKKQAWWIINWPNNNSRFFLCCQLPGGNNSPQSFVGPRQTPLWKRSSGTIWLEEEYVHCSAQLRIVYHNGSTWCSERGLAEQELEHHKLSISANKAGENSNISLSASLAALFHIAPFPGISFSSRLLRFQCASISSC